MAEQRLAVLLSHLQPSPAVPASLAARPGLQPEPRPQQLVVPANNGPIVVVGGVVLDVQAKPSGVDVQRGTSVPGQVRQLPGGVARNMAEAISQLVPPSQPAPVFISVVGDDAAGSFLASTLRALRLDLSLLMTCTGAPTPCVASVMDRTGEVAAAVADVATVELHLTPERLQQPECRRQIQQASLLLAEANLSPAALEAACATAAAARVPVFLEPVSVPKAVRLVPVLHHAAFVSPNAAELVAMADEVRRSAGLPLLPRPALDGDDEESGGRSGGGGGSSGAGSGPGSELQALLQQLGAFAGVVLGRGTGHVVLTLGALGAALFSIASPLDAADEAAAQAGSSPAAEELLLPPGSSSSSGCGAPDEVGGASASALAAVAHARRRQQEVEVVQLRALPAEVASVNGAGDTLVAGMVAALLQQHPPVEALAYGMAAAKRAVESHRNVPEKLSLAELRADVLRVLATAQRHCLPMPSS